MEEAGVDFADGVDAVGPDGSPDYGGGEGGAAVRAGKAVGLVGVADAADIAEHPESDAGLSQSAEHLRIWLAYMPQNLRHKAYSSASLCKKEEARRDLKVSVYIPILERRTLYLKVVTHLHVLGEVYPLTDNICGYGLKDHV